MVHQVNCFHSPAQEKANNALFIGNPQVFTHGTYICNWQFAALSVPTAAKNLTRCRNHKLDITAGPAPVHEQIANTAAAIIFSVASQTDHSDFFRPSNFTLLCTRVQKGNDFFTQGSERAFFALSALTALSSFASASHLLLKEFRSIALTSQKHTVP